MKEGAHLFGAFAFIASRVARVHRVRVSVSRCPLFGRVCSEHNLNFTMHRHRGCPTRTSCCAVEWRGVTVEGDATRLDSAALCSRVASRDRVLWLRRGQ